MSREIVVMTVFMWVELVFAVICITYGVKRRNGVDAFVLPMGVLMGINATFYLLRGIVTQWVLIPVASVGFVAAAVWQLRVLRNLRRSRLAPKVR